MITDKKQLIPQNEQQQITYLQTLLIQKAKLSELEEWLAQTKQFQPFKSKELIQAFEAVKSATENFVNQLKKSNADINNSEQLERAWQLVYSYIENNFDFLISLNKK